MKSLAVILFLVSFGTLFAQGEYIERGQNAIGISLSAAYHPNLLGLGGAAAVSNSGTFDFGIGYSYLFSQEESSTIQSTSTVFTPFAAVHILQQSDINPVTLSAMIEYQVHRIISKEDNILTSLGSWAAGVSVFHRFQMSERLQIQPRAGLSMISPERLPGEPSAGMTPAFEVASAFITKVNTSKMILKPSVAFSREATVYSLSFEFVDLL